MNIIFPGWAIAILAGLLIGWAFDGGQIVAAILFGAGCYVAGWQESTRGQGND